MRKHSWREPVHVGLYHQYPAKTRRRWWPAGLIALLIVLWVAVPLVRGFLLLQTSPMRSTPAAPRDLHLQAVRFHATDGVPLEGWLLLSSSQSHTVILVPGFKDDRASMLPYARFLHAAHFNVFLYDSRGTGGSGGSFSLGIHEVRDVLGAVRYLEHRTDTRALPYGILGVSMGAGVAIVAASQARAIGATVADSAYTDQQVVVTRLDSLRVGPLSIPFPPLAPWIVDRLLGTPLTSFSPLRSAGKLPPRALLLIHSRHDTNPTTPLSGAEALQRRVRIHAFLWIAPRGGHAGAYAAQPRQYESRVVRFFRRFLR